MIIRTDEKLKLEVKKIFIDKWKTDYMISKYKIHYVDNLESFVYLENNTIVGILTFVIENNDIEIVSLDSFKENNGIGSLLINEIIKYYKINNFKKVWLVTTNDNLHALKFYQKRNFNISNIYLNAVNKAREIKPSIPKNGYDDIPILHEIELTYL